MFENIFNLGNGVEDLGNFLHEARLPFRLLEKDTGEGIHTDLSIAVIHKLMMEEDIQVVFTSHNTDVISNKLLRPDCYFLLADNAIQPFCNLTDKSLREAHNLQKMYKAGAFYGQ